MNRILMILMLVALAPACGSDGDLGTHDSGTDDSGITEMGATDLGATDTGSDLTTTDMGATDIGSDLGTADTGSDLGDAGTQDLGDLGTEDAADLSDASFEDASDGGDTGLDGGDMGDMGGLPSQVDVSKTSVLTSETPTQDTFEVFLKAEPTNEVIVWVETSNPDEAVAFPVKLLFCPAGFTELYGNCATVAAAEAVLGPITEVSWSRRVPIEVNGVRDAVNDGDATYEFTFYVESADPNFASSPALRVSGVNTDIPNTDSVTRFAGLQDDALLQAIFTDEGGHRTFGYSGTNSARTMMFSTIDLNDQNKVECIYTGRLIDEPRDSQGAGQKGFNTEHSWPQSQFDQQEPLRSDIHHLFPSDSTANSNRSNYDFGMVASTSPTNPLSVAGSDGTWSVYQVRPERRGDVARAHFYMAARYRYDMSVVNGFDDDTNLMNGSIRDTEEAVLRQWHIDDPVDNIERRRNNRIEAYQNNRNPFVDWPELVGRVADF